MKRRIAALVPALAAVAIAVPLSIATPAAAHAACGTTVSDKDSSSWNKTANGANERSGTIASSSTNCTIKGIAYNTQNLDYHCWTLGNDGYTWTYLRNDSTGVTGWVRDNLLSDNGSGVYCGF
ncbi:SH3 domain-containing protein [Streptomyces sp. SID12501]|uniref:SH3 domain-containing protein n=1 Tax=Streptomyces sp. SID12501 TaxID=2706042 RepID=A0A6B3BF78_9ACTN|nr:SH3 domain-containing protein [Streptomyces sp. SID12501]NEC85107.1 SH3 domain-containing protein [Streptomyces sp. SID12501]